MTRNVKRSLAVILLTLAPMSGATEPFAFGFPRSEYVSTPTTQTVELPARRGDSASPARFTLIQSYYVLNLIGSTVFAGGTLVPQLPTLLNGGWGMTQFPFMPPSTHTYYYTTNTGSGPAKTCVWQFTVTRTGGLCSGTINQSALGSPPPVCTVDTANSYVDPVSCDTQVVTLIQ
ncbi:hypothetical protein HUW62_05040 [Myxococcus sp. AM011]|uniref:hypothetical protein n=1 Tax=Myxococcus sp. AM011 TaxID=2745200 RepID=UPI0015959764|nr:hypothetical protein [Myxococcus sp. AM011]NVJ20588.1 hypothetical protein [Myxococcus sp. AM011]